jgi:hypothetical protein
LPYTAGKGAVPVKKGVSWSLIVVGLALFVAALVVKPEEVLGSVWTGIATGLFTTGLVEWVTSAIATRDRQEQVARRAALITPIDYYDDEVDLALSNNGGEVAIHVVVGTNFPEGKDLIHTKAVQRAIEWAPMTFDQTIHAQDDPQLMEGVPWQSGRVPIEFAHIAPSSSLRLRIRAIGSEDSERPALRPLEVPVRVAWSVPGDALRYTRDLQFIFEPGGTAQGGAL